MGHRCGSNPALLWLWRRPATALIQPLAQEFTCAAGMTLKKKKKKAPALTKQVSLMPDLQRAIRIERSFLNPVWSRDAGQRAGVGKLQTCFI